MTDLPYQHPGSPPPRPEVPEGVTPAPLPPAAPAPAATPSADDTSGFPWWSPFAVLLLTFVAASAIIGLTSVFIDALGREIDLDDLPAGITIGGTLVQDAMLVGFAVMFASLAGTRPSAWAFGFRPTRFWKGLGWAMGTAGAFYVFSLVWSVALGVDENDDLAKDLGAEDSTLNLIGVSLMACVAAPLAEEFFFRGFCFPALSNRLGWIGGAIVTGFVFGAIHFGGTETVFLVPLMVFGFLLCLLYRFTGSLLPCIALHAFNNALALAVTLKWEFWQGALAVVIAPLLVLAIARPLSRRRPPQPALAQ